ncbi:HNH endonuclease [Roseovarius sp. Pro17]|uniref:HNH endonuclease n=1 Tax=Roseovarius sp. Pro17 TaxID=3108175 RepID=UPI002D77A5CB|nr:HNH endonuclease [Roseovarius sp. Pro17]
MITAKRQLIADALLTGTGAEVALAINNDGLRSGMRLWFADLDERHGPIAEIKPHGLKSHRVRLTFGNFSGAVIRQIGKAPIEDQQLARALISSISAEHEVSIQGQDLEDWIIADGSFHLQAIVRHVTGPDTDDAVRRTCQEVVVPAMAAMAELIGYDVVDIDAVEDMTAFEGAVHPAYVKRRERNPRNRLLCIRIHGDRCAACGIEPRLTYGVEIAIMEVHHLEPLANLVEPRPYDPAIDLIPLCPSCHRAVHTRRPVPLSIAELQKRMEDARA